MITAVRAHSPQRTWSWSKHLLAVVVLVPALAVAGASSTVVLDVANMTCGLCPVTVRKSLEKVPGVEHVQVDFARKTATVTFDPDRVRPEMLTAATANAGFPSQLYERNQR